MPGNNHVEMAMEQIRIAAADKQAAGIIFYIFYCSIELLVIEDYLIVKWPEQGRKFRKILPE